MTRSTAKKGITAVVAIVLLLMMTVAAAGLAYMWISQMQKGAQATGDEQVSKITKGAQFAYSIDSVRGTNPAYPSNMVVDIRNTGTLPIANLTGTNARIYVDSILNTTATGLSGSITVDGSTTYTTNIGMPAVGVKKTVRVINTDGNEFEFSCRATSSNRCEGY